MSMLIQLIDACSKKFDEKKYPSDIYYHLLERVRCASTPTELGEALSHALAWKDGKVQRDPNGPHAVHPSGTRYRTGNTRPNTLGEDHRKVLASDEFFGWATQIRNLQHFETSFIRDLDQYFHLWSSIVIPVFVLHCLQPRVYPIVDKWVFLAYTLLAVDLKEASESNVKITIESYANYQSWWLNLLGEAGIGPLSAQLNQLKQIDAGLWVLGKRVFAILNPIVEEIADEPEDDEQFSMGKFSPSDLGTDSDAFKELAIKIRNSGKTQRQAILDAADELGIQLKPSYLKYPGSHFERWRKQGLG
jgi:hypothetical protein